MTDLTLQVLNIVERHSKSDPITGKAIGELLGISERKVQEIVRTLRMNGRKVAASMSDVPGYFKGETPEDMFDTAEAIRKRGRKLFAVANKLVDFGSQQPTLYEQSQEAI